MALIVVGSVKGSPGASTLALALTALWPGRPAVLVEADPDGGDLAARFGHPDTPGLASAATAARHGGDTHRWDAHTQRLAVGADAVLGPASGEVAAAAVAALAGIPAPLAAPGRTTVVDSGALGVGSPAGWLVEVADLVLVVAWPELDCLAHVAARLAAMTAPVRARTRLVLRGTGRYPAGEIARDMGVAVAGRLPHDRWGAGILAGRYLPARGWRRLRLPRAVAHLAAHLATTDPAIDTDPDTAEPAAPAAVAGVGADRAPVAGDRRPDVWTGIGEFTDRDPTRGVRS